MDMDHRAVDKIFHLGVLAIIILLIRLVGSCRKAAPPRGVWGHAPPENFEILGALRRILEAPEVMIIPLLLLQSQSIQPLNMQELYAS